MKRTPTGSRSRVKNARELAARVVAVTRPRHMDPGIPSIPATGGKEWNVGIPPAAKPVEAGKSARAPPRFRRVAFDSSQLLVYSRQAIGRQLQVAAPHVLAWHYGAGRIVGVIGAACGGDVGQHLAERQLEFLHLVRQRLRRLLYRLPWAGWELLAPMRPAARLEREGERPAFRAASAGTERTQKAEMPAARRVRMPRYPTDTAA